MGDPSDDFTIGVEEEYQIVHPETRALRQHAREIMPEASARVGDEVTNELYLSQIEIGTPVCRTLADVRAHLVRLRRAVISAAARDGSRIAAAGTHPFSHWDAQSLTPKSRYFDLADNFRQLAREQIIFGCHVHVGIRDREAAIAVMNRSRPWLPTLLALSGNSPYWLGIDTGFCSYRSELFARFPMTGIPHEFASRAEYDDLVAALAATGFIDDGSHIYWDVRPSSHVETVEFRVADVCTTIDEAVMIAGLCRALARTCYAELERGEPMPRIRPELLRAAKFRASRNGLRGELIDVLGRRSLPASEAVEMLLEFVRPVLESAGEWDELATTVFDTFARGNGAERQRAAYARAGRFEDVVDLILEETARGT
ncbi:MAG TPA: carboxylate-amine ligase [Isosphaeraceae bacterium]